MISFLLKNFHKSTIHLKPLVRLESSSKLFNVGNVYEFANSRHHNKQSSESLLKQYFSSRLSLSTSQLQGFISDLSKNGDVKIRDHRWENLCMTIEKYQNEFSLGSKIHILRSLGRMKQDNGLYLTLYRSAVSEFHHMTIDQIADLVWSMIRVKHSDKGVIMAVYKKVHEVINNQEKIILYKQNQLLPQTDSSLSSVNIQQIQKVHHMYEGSFVRLIWALQKTTIVDSKLMVSFLKHVLQGVQSSNMAKIRIQNLTLLAYCIFQIKIQKYRIAESIINQIMKSWEELPSLSILSLSLLCQTFSKFIKYKADFNNKYQNEWAPEQIEKKKQILEKQKKFLYLVIQTIFLRQDQDVKTKKRPKNQDQNATESNKEEKLKRLISPLSGKFASKILYNLARVGMYNKQIWYKLLKSITDDVDHVEILDLSMSLCAVCDFENKDFIPQDDLKDFIYEHKKIITRRMFQIYNSLSGRTLQILKEFIRNQKIGKQLIPSWIRKQIQKEFVTLKQQSKQFHKTNQQGEFNHKDAPQKGKQYFSEKTSTQQSKKQEKVKNLFRSKKTDQRKQKPNDNLQAMEKLSNLA